MSTKVTTPKFVCKSCGKEFYVEPSRVRDRGTVLHCSWKCRYGGTEPYAIKPKQIPNPLIKRRSRSKQVCDLIDRLLLRTRKSETGCVLWKGTLTKAGYGRLVQPGTRIVLWTHRISYEFFVGPIPQGLFVLHKCDVRNCINPNHLFVGTQGDNIRDMVAKGRNIKGSKSNFAKLKEEQVHEIRRLASIGTKTREIAELFSLDISSVSYIVRRDRWKSI